MAVRDHNKNDTYCVYNINFTCTVNGDESRALNLFISEGLYGIHVQEFNKCVIDNQLESENKTCFNFGQRQKSFVLLGFCEEIPLPPMQSLCQYKQRRLFWRIYIPLDGKFIIIRTTYVASSVLLSVYSNVYSDLGYCQVRATHI